MEKERIANFHAAKLKEEVKGRKSEKTPQDETSLGQVWKIVTFLMLWAQKLPLCQRSSRGVAEKDRDDGEVAESGTASERE